MPAAGSSAALPVLSMIARDGIMMTTPKAAQAKLMEESYREPI